MTGIFILILYPNLVPSKPSVYSLGDVAERDIKAPQDFFIEDYAATEANRHRAVDQVLTVYDYDTAFLPELSRRVIETFQEFNSKLRGAETDPLQGSKPVLEGDLMPAQVQESSSGPQEDVSKQKGLFEETLGIDVSTGAYQILVKESFSDEIAQSIVMILSEVLGNGVVTNKTIFLKETDKGIVLKDVDTKEERIATDLVQFYGLDQARAMVRSIGERQLRGKNYTARNLVIDLTQRLVQPNITLNKSETEERKKKAAEEIKPILYKIKAGEMLLREGERVTEVQLLKLNALKAQTQREDVLTSSVGAALLVMCLMVTACILYLPSFGNSTGEQNKNLLFMAMVLVICFLIAQLSVQLTQSFADQEPADHLRHPTAIRIHDYLLVSGFRAGGSLRDCAGHLHRNHFSAEFRLADLFPYQRSHGSLLDSRLQGTESVHQGRRQTGIA